MYRQHSKPKIFFLNREINPLNFKNMFYFVRCGALLEQFTVNVKKKKCRIVNQLSNKKLTDSNSYFISTYLYLP